MEELGRTEEQGEGTSMDVWRNESGQKLDASEDNLKNEPADAGSTRQTEPKSRSGLPGVAFRVRLPQGRNVPTSTGQADVEGFGRLYGLVKKIFPVCPSSRPPCYTSAFSCFHLMFHLNPYVKI